VTLKKRRKLKPGEAESKQIAAAEAMRVLSETPVVVPLVMYIHGYREEIGTATYEDGEIKAVVSDAGVASLIEVKLGMFFKADKPRFEVTDPYEGLTYVPMNPIRDTIGLKEQPAVHHEDSLPFNVQDSRHLIQPFLSSDPVPPFTWEKKNPKETA
jgi:hypothetical protein